MGQRESTELNNFKSALTLSDLSCQAYIFYTLSLSTTNYLYILIENCCKCLRCYQSEDSCDKIDGLDIYQISVSDINQGHAKDPRQNLITVWWSSVSLTVEIFQLIWK